MSDNNLSLIPHPGANLVSGTRSGGLIVTEMVSEALALTKSIVVSDTEVVPLFNIGTHTFCEPDYWQIQLWAKALHITPEAVIERLFSESEGSWKSRLANGRLIEVLWIDTLLPTLSSFEWQPGLEIETLVFSVPWSVQERTLSVPLPRLQYLNCCNMGLWRLDLSSAFQLRKVLCSNNNLGQLDLSPSPNLTELSCQKNRLTELDLSKVLGLRSLNCRYNRLVDLDIRPLHNLRTLVYDAGTTQLIQRPDQHF